MKQSMRVRFYWTGDALRCSVNDPSQDPASGYNEDAQDFIMTGDWGALDPELNQHLIKYHERFIDTLKRNLIAVNNRNK